MASGSEFLISINARMYGNAVSELSSAQSAVDAAMAAFKSLEATSANTAKGLERVGAASAAMKAKLAAAMAAGDTTGITKAEKALAKLKTKEEELTAKALEAKSALTSQATAITGLVSKVEDLTAAEKAANAEGIDTAKTGDGLNKLGGPLGRIGNQAKELTEGWRDLSANLGTGGAAMAVAAVAVVALTAAIVAGTVAALKFAISMANTARNAALTLTAMQGSKEGGAALAAAFNDVTSATGITSDRLLDVTRDLKKAGVSAADLPAALKAIAQSEQALGDSSGTGELIENLKAGKTSVAALASEMDAKFGGVVADKMKGLDQQSEVLKANIGGLFSGLSIEGFLTSLQKITGLFDQNSASGKALKTIVETIFQPLINWVSAKGPAIEAFILGLEFGVLSMLVAVKKVGKALGWDTSSVTSTTDAFSAGATTAQVLSYVVGAVAAAIALLAYPIKVVIDGWNALSTVAGLVKTAVVNAWNAVTTYLSGIDLAQVGKDVIGGLAKGITENAAAVIKAITGVVNGAISTAESLLKIASPSKVFAEIGGYTAEGFSEGVDDGAPMAASSLERMTTPPSVEDPKAKRSGGFSGSISIVINGVKDAADAVDMIEAKLIEIIEGRVEQMGAPA